MEKQTSVGEHDPIPLFHTQLVSEPRIVAGKLRLRLRTMAIEEEFRGIPKETHELHELVLLLRQRRQEVTYQAVLAFLKLLRTDSKFYQQFDCSTIEEYWVKYDLGVGSRLGKLMVLVRLFEQETFALVGEKMLRQMLDELRTAQQGHGGENAAERKRDIQRIFDHYCEQHERFDHEAFLRTYREYIREKYPPRRLVTSRPVASPPAVATPATATKHERLPLPRILERQKTLEESDVGEKDTPHCPGCRRRSQQLLKYHRLTQKYEEYIAQLLQAIRILSGQHLLSHIAVPEEIRAYRNSHEFTGGP